MKPAPTTLGLLGGFQLVVDGETREVAARKVKALLCRLILQEGPAPRDLLAALLWPDSATTAARHSLRQALTELRRVLDGSALVLSVNPRDVALDTADAEVDVLNFRALAGDGRADAWARAMALYRGALLEGLEVRVDRFDDWLRETRDDLLHTAVRLCRALHEHCEDDAEEALAWSKRLLTLDPLDEDAHRDVMQLHIAADQDGAAIRQYLQCRSLLERELGIQPDPRTTALYEGLLTHRARQATRHRPSAGTRPVVSAEMDSAAVDISADDVRRSADEVRRSADEVRRSAEDLHGSAEEPRVRADRAGLAAEATSASTEDAISAAQDAGRAAAAPVPDSSPAPAAQRLRPAVVLACTLETDEDPERADAARQRHLLLITRVLRSYGGRVVAHVGNQALCGFGLERVRGTEVDRACLAAAELSATVADLRIGVASGQVIFRADQGSLVGQAAAEAQALCAEAAPGEVLVSEPVASAQRSSGRAQPVRAGVARLRTGDLDRGDDAPAGDVLFGRAIEVGQFVAVLDGSREGGYGCAMLIRGEPGIGKSRLVQEFAALATREAFDVHVGQTYDFGTVRGQDALAQVVRQLLGRNGHGAGPGARGALDTSPDFLARQAGEFHVPYLQAVLGLNPEPALAEQLDSLSPYERLERTSEAIAALVREAARERPLVLVVEDLHWADRLVTAVVPRLARAVAELPVVLVLTSRVSGEALDPAWRAALGPSPLVTLDLQPLSRPYASRLASALGAESDRIDALLERAGGNPLFIEQLVRGGHLGAGANEPALPHSIQSLAVAQLEALPEPVQQSLCSASVLGQHFAVEALTHTLGRAPDLMAAVDAGLIVRDEAGFRFHHALIRDGIYQNVLASERRRRHQRAAGFFEGQSLMLYAQHLDLADADDALQALLRAAAEEMDHYRLSRARTLTDRALRRAPDDGRALLINAQLDLALGNSARAAEGFRACRAAEPDNAVAGHALIGLGMALNQIDDFEGAVAALREATALDQADAAYQADAWMQLGNALFPQGLTKECLEAHETSLQYARRAGSTLRQARAEGGLGDAYYQQGAMLTAFEHYDRCVQLGEAHRHPSVVPANLAMRALTLQYQNCLAEAVADCERAIDLAGRSANVRHQLLAHNVLAGVETFRGRPEAGLDHARRTLALSRRIGSRRFALDALSQIAHLSWVAGRIPQAREALEEADGLLDATMSAFGGAYVRGLQAACAEDAAARDTFLHEGERLLGRHAVSHCHVYFYMTAMEIGLVSGNAEQVLRFAAALERYTAKEPLPFTDFFIRRARCLVADDADERESLVAQARAAGLGTGLRLLTPGTR